MEENEQINVEEKIDEEIVKNEDNKENNEEEESNKLLNEEEKNNFINGNNINVENKEPIVNNNENMENKQNIINTMNNNNNLIINSNTNTNTANINGNLIIGDYLITIQYTKLLHIPYFKFGNMLHFYCPCFKFKSNKITLSQMPTPPFGINTEQCKNILVLIFIYRSKTS